MRLRYAIFAAVAVLALGASPAASGEATVIVSHTTSDFTGAVLTCPTEQVVFSGTATTVSTSVITPSLRRSDTFVTNLSGLTAVGQTTGTVYRVTGVTHASFSDAIGGETKATTSTFVQTWLLVPTGGGTTLSFQEILTATFDPEDELVKLIFHQAGECD